jgi:hypothetical protein
VTVNSNVLQDANSVFAISGSSFTVNTNRTVAGQNIFVNASGAVSLAGSLDTSTIATGTVGLNGTTINQTGGAITAQTLVASATSVAPGATGVVLGQTNHVKNVSVTSSVPGGAVTVKSDQAVTVTSGTTAPTGTVTGVTAGLNGDITLTGASVALSNVVTASGTGNVSITGSGGITGGALVSGFDVSLTTSTGAIGASGSLIQVDATDGLDLTTTATTAGNGDVFVNLTGAGHITVLSDVSVSTDGSGIGGTSSQKVEIDGLTTLDGGTITYRKDSVTFVGTSGVLTQLVGSDITAANLTLKADVITLGGALHAPTGQAFNATTGTILLAPNTVGANLLVSGLPTGSTASKFQFGDANTGTVTLSSGLNLTGSTANLVVQAGTGVSGGTIIFNTTVTMDTGKTVELIGSNGIISNLAAGTDAIAGSGVTVIFSGVNGDIGSTVTPFEMNVATLGTVADGGIGGSVGNVWAR